MIKSPFVIMQKKKTSKKPLDPVLCEAGKTFQSHNKTPINERTTTLFQQAAISNNTDITYDDDHIEKRIPKDDNPFHMVYH